MRASVRDCAAISIREGGLKRAAFEIDFMQKLLDQPVPVCEKLTAVGIKIEGGIGPSGGNGFG